MLHGFTTFDPAIRIAGVILNRIGSQRHEQVLRQACAQAGVAVLGAIPRRPELSLPSRHLGLVTAAEHGTAALRAVTAMTEIVAAHVDIAAVAAIAGSAVDDPAWEPSAGVATIPAHVTVAMAAGKAFTFGYAEHAEMLQAAGADVVGFDPLTDTLPSDTDALVLPGGFPSSSPPSCPPMMLPANRSGRSPDEARRCTPNVRGSPI